MPPLTTLPGVGPNLAAHLHALGIHSTEDLIGTDPESLYAQDCLRHGGTLDRCVLYVYRCAVYCAQTADPEPALTKWWNWKTLP